MDRDPPPRTVWAWVANRSLGVGFTGNDPCGHSSRRMARHFGGKARLGTSHSARDLRLGEGCKTRTRTWNFLSHTSIGGIEQPSCVLILPDTLPVVVLGGPSWHKADVPASAQSGGQDTCSLVWKPKFQQYPDLPRLKPRQNSHSPLLASVKSADVAILLRSGALRLRFMLPFTSYTAICTPSPTAAYPVAHPLGALSPQTDTRYHHHRPALVQLR